MFEPRSPECDRVWCGYSSFARTRSTRLAPRIEPRRDLLTCVLQAVLCPLEGCGGCPYWRIGVHRQRTPDFAARERSKVVWDRNNAGSEKSRAIQNHSGRKGQGVCSCCCPKLAGCRIFRLVSVPVCSTAVHQRLSSARVS